jgi:hypothetical protein
VSVGRRKLEDEPFSILSLDWNMKTRIEAGALYDEESRTRAAEVRLSLISRAQPKELEAAPGSSVSGADRFLSARAVGAMTGDASKRKIRRWVDRGEFNSYALDGRTVYSEREVIAFVERVKARGPSRAPWRGNSGVAASERPSNAPKQ